MNKTVKDMIFQLPVYIYYQKHRQEKKLQNTVKIDMVLQVRTYAFSTDEQSK